MPTSVELFSPATPDEAISLITAQSPTFTTASQVRLFGQSSLETLFDRGARRPELIWAARENGREVGLLGARTFDQDLALIDLLALPANSEAADVVIGAATVWARSFPRAEASFGAPATENPVDDSDVAAVVEAFAAHGWRVLVTRRHYGFAPTAGLGDGVRLPARLERATESDRARLEALVRQVLPGSLDVRDQNAIAEHGLDSAAARLTAELIDADPIEYVRFAVIDGQDAGLVIHRLMPSGTAVVAFVGVAAAFRGRGLARGLVAAATRELVTEGATTLVAGTDYDNWPMARGFAAVGWQQTEARIDLVLG